MSLSIRLATCAGLLFAGANVAFAGGTVTDGTATYQIVGNPAYSSGNGDANLTWAGISDYQSRNTWYYRTATGNNSLFSNLDTPTESYVGNKATITYTNAGPGTTGLSRFNAVITLTLSSTSSGQALVQSSLVITSLATNSASQTFNLFNVIGFDLGANSQADTYHVVDSTAISGTVIDTATSNFVQFQATGANRYAFNSGSTLNSSLTTTQGNLTTGAGSNASDFTSAAGAAAFQWTQVLAPGQSFTINTAYSVNQTLVPEPQTWAWLAMGIAVFAVAAIRRRKLA